MSIELVVFLERGRWPSIADWVRELEAVGCRWRPRPDVIDADGYEPGALLPEDGADTAPGFELYVVPVGPEERRLLAGRRDAKRFDRAALFRTGSDEDELLAAGAAAATLATLSGGLIHDPHHDEKPFVPAPRALAWYASLRGEVPPVPAAKAHETAVAWRDRCLPIARAVHPDYAVNRAMRGPFIEYARRLPNGLWSSFSFLYRRRDNIALSFGVGFSLCETSCLFEPLWLGGRRDHNFTVWHAYCQHLGIERPRGVHSTYGGWRSNTFDLVELCMKNAEETLLPAYVERIKAGKQRFVTLVETARDVLGDAAFRAELDAPVGAAHPFVRTFAARCAWPDARPDKWLPSVRRYFNLLVRLGRFGADPRAVLADRDVCLNVSASEVALGTATYLRLPEARQAIALVATYVDSFLTMAGELDAMVAVARAL